MGVEKVLHVQSVNDYARHVGAPVLHPSLPYAKVQDTFPAS